MRHVRVIDGWPGYAGVSMSNQTLAPFLKYPSSQDRTEYHPGCIPSSLTRNFVHNPAIFITW